MHKNRALWRGFARNCPDASHRPNAARLLPGLPPCAHGALCRGKRQCLPQPPYAGPSPPAAATRAGGDIRNAPGVRGRFACASLPGHRGAPPSGPPVRTGCPPCPYVPPGPVRSAAAGNALDPGRPPAPRPAPSNACRGTDAGAAMRLLGPRPHGSRDGREIPCPPVPLPCRTCPRASQAPPTAGHLPARMPELRSGHAASSGRRR